MQNISIGMLGSIEPVGVKPRNPEKLPSWKIHTRAPNMTDRLSRLRTVAFSGSRTLPVIRNSTPQVTSRMRAATSGTRSSRVARKSVVSAG